MAEEIDMVPREKYQPNLNFFFFRDPASEIMEIPSEFIKHLTEPPPKKVVFRNNSGNLWTMMLRRKNDCLLLEEGWRKFATDNNLSTGESLLLEYDGIRVFDVRIFGQTGCEVIRCEVKIEEIDNDEEEHEEHNNLSYSSEEEEKRDSKGEWISLGKKQSQRLQRKEKKARGHSSKVRGLPRGRYRPVIDKTVIKYLSNPSNPFMVTRPANRFHELHVKAKIITDYGLKFPEVINFIDSFGPLEGRTVNWGDGRLCIKKWISICRRNKLVPKDEIICEFQQRKGWVRSIKVHVIRNGEKAI